MSSKGEDKSNLTQDEARVLLTLNEKGLTFTKPIQSGDTLTYEGLKELREEHPKINISEIMKSLLDKEYLKESGYSNILVCPKCGSTSILKGYTCPHCQSRKIKKSKLAEHKLCGYIGNLDDFDQVECYICPKCKTKITKISSDPTMKQDPEEVLRVIGSSFACDACGAKFEKPGIIHICSDCDSDFPDKEAGHTKIPIYEVVKNSEPETLKHIIASYNPEQKVEENIQVKEPVTEIIVNLLPKTSNEVINEIESVFKKKGFTFQCSYKQRGKSGFEQSFDAAAKREGQLILIDVSKTGDQADLIGLVGKKKDVDSKMILLIDTTGNPHLVPLGKQYNIAVLNSGEEGYIEKLSDLLDAETSEQRKKPFSWKGKSRSKP